MTVGVLQVELAKLDFQLDLVISIDGAYVSVSEVPVI